MKFNLYFDYTNEKNINDTFNKIFREYHSGEVGYYHLPERSIDFLDIEFKDYDEIVVIGIGGSSLGCKAVYEMTDHIYDLKKMYFLENPDPVELDFYFSQIKNPLFFAISKSGKTIETLSIMRKVIEKFNIKPEDDRLKIITDPLSPLEKFAKEWKLQYFNIPSNVGGRFSVLSAVGIVPLKAAGMDVEKLLQGAKDFRDSFFTKNEMHLLKKACFYAENINEYPVNVLFAYGSILKSFKDWFVQLFGESLGKNGNEIMPVGHVGTTDQHSFLQLLMEGRGHKTISFLKIEDFKNTMQIPKLNLPFLEDSAYAEGHTFEELINKECEATKEALLTKNYPIDEIILPTPELKYIGELIMYYEILTSAIGAFLGINTYNQPGVELGKRILKTKF